MLRRDRSKKRVVAEGDSTEPSETIVGLVEVPVHTAILNTPSSVTVQIDAAAKELQPLASKCDAATTELQNQLISDVAGPSSSVSWRSSYDNPAKRQFFETGKLKEALSYIHEQLKIGKATHESLFLKFNFPSCYDIEFLKLLAQELNKDISGILSKKRVAPKDVLNDLISKLI